MRRSRGRQGILLRLDLGHLLRLLRISHVCWLSGLRELNLAQADDLYMQHVWLQKSLPGSGLRTRSLTAGAHAWSGSVLLSIS